MQIADGFGLCQRKINREKSLILSTLLEIFIGYRIATPTHPYREYYTTWVYSDGQPLRTYLANGDLLSTQLGILGPAPTDTRPRILNLPIGRKKPAELITDINIKYEPNKLGIQTIDIKIFGKKNKGKIRTFANRIITHTDQLVATVVDDNPRFENKSYLTN